MVGGGLVGEELVWLVGWLVRDWLVGGGLVGEELVGWLVGW